MKKMIPANLKPSILIKEKDQYVYHLEISKVRINPKDPKHPITTGGVRAMRPRDYNNFFVIGTAEAKIRHLKSMGWDSVEVVHDPTMIDRIAAMKKAAKELDKAPAPKVEPDKVVPFKVLSDEDKIEKARLSELKSKEDKKIVKKGGKK